MSLIAPASTWKTPTPSTETTTLDSYLNACREAATDPRAFLHSFREMQAYADVYDWEPTGVSWALRAQRLRTDWKKHAVKLYRSDLLGGTTKAVPISGVHLSVGTWRKCFMDAAGLHVFRTALRASVGEYRRPMVFGEIGCGHGASAFVAEAICNSPHEKYELGETYLFDYPDAAALARSHLNYFGMSNAHVLNFGDRETPVGKRVFDKKIDVLVADLDLGAMNSFELEQLVWIFKSSLHVLFRTNYPDNLLKNLDTIRIGGEGGVLEKQKDPQDITGWPDYLAEIGDSTRLIWWQAVPK